jgi:hypothetical protein
MQTIYVTLSNYPTVIESTTIRAAIYSDNPSIAIQAPCGGYDVARPADLDDMVVVFGTTEKIK